MKQQIASETTATLSTGAAARRLHVVVVDEELPFPTTSGKRIRSLNLITRLAQRHRITYICHRNTDLVEMRNAEAYLRDHHVETISVARAVPKKSGPAFAARLVGNLFSPSPYSVATHNSAALRSALRRYAAAEQVDLWHCEWTPYAAALRTVPGIRWLVMAHNIESQIWQRYYETERNPARRWYIKHQWHKFERFERAAFGEALQTVTVSDEDAQLARRHYGGHRVAVVDNGVDVGHFQPANIRREANRILFLGSLDWRPNQDAVQAMLDHVFPAVRAVNADARLWIVGRNPPAWLVDRAARTPHVDLCGDVADVRPYLQRSSVMAVPLRIGGGSRLKILESLATGLPVVSTRVGAEGLKLVDGEHLNVVDHPDQMGRALLECLRHPEAALAKAQRGRQVVIDRYDWDALADKLEQIWIECAECCART